MDIAILLRRTPTPALNSLAGISPIQTKPVKAHARFAAPKAALTGLV